MARWLEMLTEFTFQLEHHAGPKHGNADRLSRKERCQDCRQSELMERRDGVPSHQQGEIELSEEELPPSIAEVVTRSKTTSN